MERCGFPIIKYSGKRCINHEDKDRRTGCRYVNCERKPCLTTYLCGDLVIKWFLKPVYRKGVRRLIDHFDMTLRLKHCNPARAPPQRPRTYDFFYAQSAIFLNFFSLTFNTQWFSASPQTSTKKQTFETHKTMHIKQCNIITAWERVNVWDLWQHRCL